MDKRGFSLIELNVCCALIAILATVSYPYWANMREAASFRQEARALFGNLQRARVEAIKQNAPAVFQLFPDGYIIFIDDGGGGGERGDWEIQPGEKILLRHQYSQNVRMALTTFSKSRGRFNPQPGIQAGRIVLENTSGLRQEVVVNIIGRIRIAKL